MSLLLCAGVNNLEQWRAALAAAFPDETLVVWPDVPSPADVRVALVAKPPHGALAAFPQLELICSLWAGVDRLLADPAWPRHVPLTRLIDARLTAAMVESVLLHVLSAHRMAPRYRLQQTKSEWKAHEQPPASDRTVGILGFGELGRACGEALLALGFRVVGWNRSGRMHPRIDCLHGEEGLAGVLAQSDIIVNLLPNTPNTRGLLDGARLDLLPDRATVINVGRGSVIDDNALLAALDSGRIEAAILDVFNQEPLPRDHRYWQHERVWMYPHVAAETDPHTAASIVADTVRRFRAAQALPEQVLIARGY